MCRFDPRFAGIHIDGNGTLGYRVHITAKIVKRGRASGLSMEILALASIYEIDEHRRLDDIASLHVSCRSVRTQGVKRGAQLAVHSELKGSLHL